ncbi:uncharacterized protein LOC142334749 [Convolutriloba macropyga]|uniref:uncharacterized protein LOC142334749 n=1 Tax=Convolutriloba macropyga TaxID=536237 RepID=UPI003F528EC2
MSLMKTLKRSEVDSNDTYSQLLKTLNHKCWKPERPRRKPAHLTVSEDFPKRKTKKSETATEFINVPFSQLLREDSRLFFRRYRTEGFRWMPRQLGSADRTMNPGTQFVDHSDPLLHMYNVDGTRKLSRSQSTSSLY